MARWQLWIRRPLEEQATKLWDGADATTVYDGRTYDAALGVALRTAADAVLRDTNTTDPSLRTRPLFTRHGPGNFGGG